MILGAAAAVAAAAALAVVVLRKPQPIATLPLEAAIDTPVTGQLTRSEIVLASGEVFVGEAAAHVGSGPLGVGARVRTAAGRACVASIRESTCASAMKPRSFSARWPKSASR